MWRILLPVTIASTIPLALALSFIHPRSQPPRILTLGGPKIALRAAALGTPGPAAVCP